MKKLTKGLVICEKCGMALINCVCNEAPKIKLKHEFFIITSEKEFIRPSNSAKLFKFSNDSNVHLIKWERNICDKKIEKLIQNKENICLVDPIENEYNVDITINRTEEKLNFILIDGTWKESSKIYRKSDYLHKIPVLFIKNLNNSEYELRNGTFEGGVCTLEIIIEILNRIGESESGEKLNLYFKKFKKRFFATVNGHKFKD